MSLLVVGSVLTDVLALAGTTLGPSAHVIAVLAGLVAVGGVVVATRLATRSIVMPVENLRRGLLAGTSGSDAGALEESGPAEIARLTRAFNEASAARQRAEREAQEGEQRLSRVVTSRKLAEEALVRSRASERQAQAALEAFIDAAPVAIAVLDVDLRHLTVNQRMAGVTGLTIEDHLGRTLAEVAPQHGVWAEPMIRRVLATGEPIVGVEVNSVTAEHPDGGMYLLSYFQVRDSDDDAVGVGAIALDVTEQRRADQSLRDSEERFSAFMNASPAVAWMKDEDGRYLFVNRAWRALFATDAEDVRGKTNADWLPGEIAARNAEADRAAARTDAPVEALEDLGSVSGGRQLWQTVRFPILKDSGERQVGGIAIDVTQQIIAAEELEQHARRLGLLREIDAGILRAQPAALTIGNAISRVRDLVPCVGVAVMEFDDDLEFGQIVALNTSAAASVTVGSRIRLDSAIDYDALRAHRSTIVDDIEALAGKQAHRDVLRRAGVRSYLMAPLIVEGKLIGSLNIAGESPHQYGSVDAQIAQEVADQLALALHQEQLRKREHRATARLRELHAVDSALLSSLSPQDVAQQVVADLRQTLGVELGAIMTIDLSAGEATTIAADGMALPIYELGTTRKIPEFIDLNVGVTTRVYAFGEDEARVSPAVAQLLGAGLPWALRIPLETEDELLGAAFFFTGRPELFEAGAIETTEEVARHLALVLLRMRLQESERLAHERTRALHAIAEVGLARLPLEQLLSEMLQRVCELVGADVGSVLLLDEAGGVLHAVALVGIAGGVPMGDIVIPVGTSVAGRVAATGEPLAVADLGEIEDLSADVRHGARSAAAAPLLVGERLIGVVAVGSKTRRDFDADHLHLLEIAGERIAAAIHRSTVEQELERRVVERTSELRQANADLDAFSTSVSHDLRAPLRAMRGFSGALLEDYSDALGEEGSSFATRIIEAADRMGELMDDLLAFDRLSRQEIQLDRVDLDPIVDQVLVAFEGKRGGRTPTVDVARPLGVVNAHAATLALVLSNLVDNAIKFTQPGTFPRVSISSSLGGERIRVEVTDTGIGIAAEKIHRIFDVFERLHGAEVYPGTGIGLASVKRGVERMGGTVGVDSAPGSGSTFWFELARA